MFVTSGLTATAIAMGAIIASPGTPAPGTAPVSLTAPVGARGAAAAPLLRDAGCRPWLDARARWARGHGYPGAADVLRHRAERRADRYGCV